VRQEQVLLFSSLRSESHQDDIRHFRDFFRDLRIVSPGLTNANVPEYVTNVSIC